MTLTESEVSAIIGVIGALMGVAIGWGLTTITEIRRQHAINKAKKKSILLELEDLHDAFKNAEVAVRSECEIYANNEYRGVAIRPVKLKAPILAEFFKDISHTISRNERINLKSIMYNLDNYNSNLDIFIQSRTENRSYIDHIDLRMLVLFYIRVLIETMYLIKKHGLKHEVQLNTGNLLEAKNEVESYKSKLRQIRSRL